MDKEEASLGQRKKPYILMKKLNMWHYEPDERAINRILGTTPFFDQQDEHWLNGEQDANHPNIHRNST